MDEKINEMFPSIMKTQVLTDEMMSEIESGDPCDKGCQPGCKNACTPGNKNLNSGNGTPSSPTSNPTPTTTEG
jgi:hypothetical protein